MKWNELNNHYKSKFDDLEGKSPYDILGVEKDALPEDIKEAYKEKIKLYHPDGKDEFMESYNSEMSKIINAAYDSIIEQLKL